MLEIKLENGKILKVSDEDIQQLVNETIANNFDEYHGFTQIFYDFEEQTLSATWYSDLNSYGVSRVDSFRVIGRTVSRLNKKSAEEFIKKELLEYIKYQPEVLEYVK